MGLNLGRGSILCPYRAFAILGGNDDHDRELCPSSQEATADLHLLFHCRQDGILARLALLPQIPFTAPGPPPIHPAVTHHRDFPMPLPQVAKVMKGTPHLPQLGGELNSQPQPRGKIFHSLASIWFPGLYKLRPAHGPLPPYVPTHLGN